MITASWGTINYKADAQKCADEIMEICDEHKSATPQLIVDKARDSKSELHKCFTWDNDKAADKWRLQEARIILCNIRIAEIKEDNKPQATPIRFFYKTNTTDGYKPTKMIFKNETEYKRLLERCASELRAIKSKYQNINEYNEIWELIN